MRTLLLACLAAAPSLAAANAVPRFSYQRCGQRIPAEIVAPSLEQGLACLTRLGATQRLSEFSALAAGPAVEVTCGGSAEGYRAYAHQAQPSKGTPPRVEISDRMMREVAASRDTRDQHSLMFHEVIHLLHPDYVHGYRRGLADVAASCGTCCFPGTDQRGTYLEHANVTAEDLRRHCQACISPRAPENTSPVYWATMLRNSLDKNRGEFFVPAFLSSLDERPALAAAAADRVLPRDRWAELVCAPARADGIDLAPYSPQVRELVAQRCPGLNAPRTGRAGPSGRAGPARDAKGR